MSKWAGAISTLIPSLCISAQPCSRLQLYVDYCLEDDAIFPVVLGEIIYWKIRFPGNFKFYPTLIIRTNYIYQYLHPASVYISTE